ncbi:hypothetical protein ACF0H5_011972 [Mactra antiquata]
MTERKIQSTVNKTLLKNVIRHTDSHNKVVEETEMWKQRQREIKNVDSMGSRNSFLKDRGGVDMRYEFSDHRQRRAHMDDEPKSTYWMNELYKAEEADENRWGHSGFKELYPEKFNSDASTRGKKRKRSHDNSSHSPRRDYSTDSDSTSTDNSDRDRKHRDRRKKKEKSKKKRKKKRKQSDSESNHDSDVDNDRQKKKRKKKHKLKDRKKKKKRKRKHSDNE